MYVWFKCIVVIDLAMKDDAVNKIDRESLYNLTRSTLIHLKRTLP